MYLHFHFVVVCHFPFLEFVLKILLILITIVVVIVQEDWASCIWPSYWNGLQKEIGNKHSSINLLFILLRFTNFLTILILDFIKIYKIGNNKHSSSYQISCFLILDYTCLDLLYKYLVALYSVDTVDLERTVDFERLHFRWCWLSGPLCFFFFGWHYSVV